MMDYGFRAHGVVDISVMRPSKSQILLAGRWVTGFQFYLISGVSSLY